MTRFLLATLLACACLRAQVTFELDTVDVQWPAVIGSGDDIDLTVGQFVEGHPAVNAVTVRGGELFLFFEPARWSHFVPAGLSGVQAVATSRTIDSRADSLLALSAAGLRVLRYDDGFVDALPSQGLVTEWAGGEHIVTASTPNFAAGRAFLIYNENWIKLGVIDPTDMVLPGLSFPVPPNASVLAAAFVEANADSKLPEIAVVYTNGVAIYTVAASLIDSYFLDSTESLVVPLSRSGGRAFGQLRRNGPGPWELVTVVNDAVNGLQPISGGTIALSTQPVALEECDLDGDEYRDVVLSARDSVRRLFRGTPTGLSTAAANRIDIFDVRPALLGASPRDNLAPLVVADLNRDGTDDFLIAQTESEQMVTMLSVRTQVQEIVYGTADDAGKLETIALDLSMGMQLGANFATPDDVTNQVIGMLGLRLFVPRFEFAGTLEFLIYTLDGSGPIEFSRDVADIVPSDRFHVEVDPSDYGETIDVMLPITERPGTPIPRKYKHFLIQAHMLEKVDGEPLKASESLMLEGAIQLGSGSWSSFVSQFDNDAQSGWWFDIVEFEASTWTSTVIDPSGGDAFLSPPDNRFFGAVFKVPSMRAGSEPPHMPVAKGLKYKTTN